MSDTGRTTEREEQLAELRERSAVLRSIINAALEAIVVIDDRGIIREFSHQGESMFGYSAGDVIGQNVSILMPAPYRDEHDGYIARYRQSGDKRIIGKVINENFVGTLLVSDGLNEKCIYFTVGAIRMASSFSCCLTSSCAA